MLILIVLIAALSAVAMHLHMEVPDRDDKARPTRRSNAAVRRELEQINSVRPNHFVGDANFWYHRWKEDA